MVELLKHLVKDKSIHMHKISRTSNLRLVAYCLIFVTGQFLLSGCWFTDLSREDKKKPGKNPGFN